jgi:predicted transcriptional regulator
MNRPGVTLDNVVAGCALQVLTGPADMSRRIDTVFASDLMSDVLAFSTPGALLVTGLTNVQTVVTADIADVSGVVFTRGKRPDAECVERAAAAGIPLLSTRLDTFTLCGELYRLGLRGARPQDGE